MKKILNYLLFFMLLVCGTVVVSSCGDDDDDDSGISTDYDIIQINGKDYACYGYRCSITYTSTWSLSKHKGTIALPCGELSDAQKGEYDYDYMFYVELEGSQDLSTGIKLETLSPELAYVFDDYGTCKYVSGSATVIQKEDDKYLTVKFESMKFSNNNKTFTLNGTVQLDLDED